ncbi:MAG: hypothetical protein ACFFA0_05085 [Promethearchaeota archaeon]
MEKPQSYYEWKLQFTPKKKRRNSKRETKKNILGIEDHQFEEFLKEWKKKNLPLKGKSRKISY